MMAERIGLWRGGFGGGMVTVTDLSAAMSRVLSLTKGARRESVRERGDEVCSIVVGNKNAVCQRVAIDTRW